MYSTEHPYKTACDMFECVDRSRTGVVPKTVIAEVLAQIGVSTGEFDDLLRASDAADRDDVDYCRFFSWLLGRQLVSGEVTPFGSWSFDGTWKVVVGQGRVNWMTAKGDAGVYNGGSYGDWHSLEFTRKPESEVVEFTGAWRSGKTWAKGDTGRYKGVVTSPKMATKTYWTDGSEDYAPCMMQKVLDDDEEAQRRIGMSTIDLGALKAQGTGAMPSDPALWGLEFSQLQHLRDFLQVVQRTFDGRRTDKEYKPPNMYELCNDQFKPLTRGTSLSISGLYNRSAFKLASVFISHSWAEDFLSFVSFLEVGSGGTQKPLKIDDVMWVCTLCVDQNADIGDVVGTTPENSPFAQVMKQCPEIVVVFNDRVDLYSRVWCCYEMFLSLEWKKDVRAVGTPIGWLEIVDRVRQMADIEDKKKAVARLNDENPVKVREAQCSVQHDKDQIMAAIRAQGEDTFDRMNVTVSKLRVQAWDDLLVKALSFDADVKSFNRDKKLPDPSVPAAVAPWAT